MNKGILMISLGRLLMNIDLEEIFKNAFEIAKKNGLHKYKDELENIRFDKNKGLYDLCINADFAGLFAGEIINILSKIKTIDVMAISKIINSCFMENKKIPTKEIENLIFL